MILTITRDIAGVQSLVPVLEALQKHDYPFQILAEGVARDVLPTHGFVPHQLNTPLNHYFDALSPSLVLTTTSIQPGIEKEVIRLARQKGVPSIAILDTWTNLSARFDDLASGQKRAFVPNIIATFDQKSVQQLVGLGISAEQIVVTGNPHFAELAKRPIKIPAPEVKAQLDIGHKIMLFVSEPLADEWYAQYTTQYPTESQIRETLKLCSQHLPPQSTLVVKLHPIEDEALAQDVMATANCPHRIIKAYDPFSLVMASDWVIGINSNLLLEAALLGKPSYSLFLEQYITPTLDSIGQYFSPVQILRNADDLQAVLKTSHSTKQSQYPHHQAVDAVLTLIQQTRLSR